MRPITNSIILQYMTKVSPDENKIFLDEYYMHGSDYISTVMLLYLTKVMCFQTG